MPKGRAVRAVGTGEALGARRLQCPHRRPRWQPTVEVLSASCPWANKISRVGRRTGPGKLFKNWPNLWKHCWALRGEQMWCCRAAEALRRAGGGEREEDCRRDGERVPQHPRLPRYARSDNCLTKTPHR